MRPSDVPTYVEAGAADLGITGKDVLLEQQGDRIVYEILDLAYGACRMVLAGRQGDQSLGESERRVGGMRIATKYPRIAERHFEETGRQADVIEVKGSVELAPAGGPRRRDRRPGGHRAGRSRRTASRSARRSPPRRRGWSPTASPTSCAPPRSTTWWSGCARRTADEDQALRLGWERTGRLAAEIRALQPALGEVSESVGAIIEEVRERRRRAPSPRSRRASAAGHGRHPIPFASPDDALGAAASRLEPDMVAALETAAANIRAVAEAQLAEDRNGEAETGPVGRASRGRGRRRPASMRRAAEGPIPRRF